MPLLSLLRELSRWKYLLCCLSNCISLVTGLSAVAWVSPRVGLIRDSIYIDGGTRYTGEYYENGTIDLTAYPYSDTGPYGTLYKLNLTRPLNATNATDTLEYVVPTQYDPGAAVMADGAMFVSENGFYTYAGMSSTYRDDNQTTWVTAWDLYAEGSELSNSTTIQSNVSVTPPILEKPSTWIRCCGADTSVPSEKLGFYFSGLLPNDTYDLVQDYYEYQDGPNKVSQDLVICNTTHAAQPKCDSLALPSHIKGRGESSMVWLPIGEDGALAVIGGIGKPFDLYYETEDFTTDATLLSEVPIFDIHAQTWYLQPVVGEPPYQELAAACAVVAAAGDGSSYNVYIYGGYTGWFFDPDPNINDTRTQSQDDVWVLSMPAFEWIKVSNGTSQHRRQNHKCLQPYPNQMLSIGGRQDNSTWYLNSSFISVFDLNKLNWSDTYDPASWSEYKVPKLITNVIGGKDSGGADKTAPNMDPDLRTLFKQSYKKDIPYYWPYAKQPGSLSMRQAFVSWLGPITALVGYLFIASFAFIGIVMLRRRMAFEANNISTPEIPSRSRLVSWMHNATPLYGLNLNLTGDDKKPHQDEEYHELRQFAADHGSLSYDEDITSAKTTGTSIRSYDDRSFVDEEGRVVEMRTFLGPGSAYTP